jgi:hypothetical protein
MTIAKEGSKTRTQKWGWGILLVVSALLALNGVAVYFMSASPAIFEQDTGVPMSEVRQAYPTVADQVVREGQTIAILLGGFGLLALMVALEGLRHRSRWAWNAGWVVVATLAGIAIKTLVQTGRLDIGLSYLALAAVVTVGQLLARRGLAS